MLGKKFTCIFLIFILYRVAVFPVNPISLTIRTYTDHTGTMTAAEITDNLLKRTGPDIYAGTGTGALWIAVRFPTPDRPVVVCFGDEPVYTAELYVRSENGWKSAGLAGKAVPNVLRSVPSWQTAIAIPAAPANGSHFREILLRVSDTDAIALKIRIRNIAHFTADAESRTIRFLLNTGMLCALTAVLLTAAIVQKNRIYALCTGIAVSLLLYQTAANGFGSTYIWNRFADSAGTPYLHYLFTATAACFGAVLITDRLVHNETKREHRRLLQFCITVCAVLLGVILELRSSHDLYVAFLLIGLACVAGLHRYGIVCSKRERKYAAVTICWSAALLIAIIRRLCLTLRYKSPSALFRIFDGDTLPVFDVVFILITAPFVCRVAVRCFTAKLQLTRSLENDRKRRERQHLRACMDFRIRRELTNSAAVIRNCAAGLFPEADEPTLRRTIRTNSEHLLQLLNVCGFLEKRIDGKSDGRNAIPVKVHDLLATALRHTGEQAASKNISVQVRHTPPKSFVFLGTPFVIEYVFTVLLENVLKYANRNTETDVYLDYRDGTLSYDIRAAAVSLSVAEGERLFHVSAEDDCGNVSLYLVRRLCEVSGGTALVAEKRNGTVFSATIQLAEHAQTEQVLPADDDNAFGNDSDRKSAPSDAPELLIANDNGPLRQYIRALFAGAYNIRCVSTGPEALEVLKDCTPDLIICDRLLPMISGYDLFKKCSQSPQLSAVPFILLGTEFSEQEKIGFLSEGITACIGNDFNPAVLKAQISSFMQIGKKTRNKIFADIITAVSQTMGQPTDVLSTASTRTLLDAGGLSEREKEIATLISYGKSDKEIAAELNISSGTVASHNKNIFKKLAVHSRVELISKLR